jgi:hemerythrin superfamily protein
MTDALQLLADQHQQVSDLFTEIGQTSEPGKRRTVVNRIVKALSQHASIEEKIFYPAVAGRVVEGGGFIAVSLEEHEKTKVQLRKLDKMKPSDPLFDPSVGELIKEVKEHVADEEMQLFPRVRAAFSGEELAELGQKMAGREAAAPVR